MDPRTVWKMSIRSVALVVIGAAFCWLSVRAEANLARHQNMLPPIESGSIPATDPALD